MVCMLVWELTTWKNVVKTTSIEYFCLQGTQHIVSTGTAFVDFNYTCIMSFNQYCLIGNIFHSIYVIISIGTEKVLSLFNISNYVY